MKKYLPLLFSILFVACSTSVTSPEVSMTPIPPHPATSILVEPGPTHPPTPMLTLTPTPTYLRSEDETIQVELGQLFGFRWNQSAVIPSENLTLIHTTDIINECPDDPGVVCEVQLESMDYLELVKDGISSGKQPWDSEMILGDYLIATTDIYSGYDYDNHHFEIVLSIERLDEAISLQQTRVVEFDIREVVADCDKVYRFQSREWPLPEVHFVWTEESVAGHVDIVVERSVAPIILVLSAYDPTEWELHLSEDVEIEEIILYGDGNHTVLGAESIPILDFSGPDQYTGTWGHARFVSAQGHQDNPPTGWIHEMEKGLGVPLSTFTGCSDEASEFIFE